MKALKIIGGIVLGLAAVVAILGAIAPKDYNVERSINIDASQEAIMEHVKSLQKMQAWSPWADLDPNMQVSYEGEDGTVGSSSTWAGNKDVGKGKQEITAITDNRVDYKVTFIEPWESVSPSFVTIEPEGEGSKVTWGFSGSSPFPWNAMMLFMNMDEMLGNDFEKGLGKLKTVIESSAATGNTFGGYDIATVDMQQQVYVGVKDSMSTEKLGAFFGKNYPAIFAALGKAGVQPAGRPSALYYSWDEATQTTSVAAVAPVLGGADTKVAGFETFVMPAGKMLKIVYYGAYEQVGGAHEAMHMCMEAKKLTANGPAIEEYVTEPMNEPDTSKWITNIYYPVL